MREVVGREARLPLLAIVDDWRADLLQPSDRVSGRGVLLGLELSPGDLAFVVVGVGLLELHRPR